MGSGLEIVLIWRDWKILQGPGGWETASWVAHGRGRRAGPTSFLLSSFHLSHFLSPERDSCGPRQEPGPGSWETWVLVMSVTCQVTLDGHFTTWVSVSSSRRYLRLPETFSSCYWGRKFYLKSDFHSSCFH